MDTNIVALTANAPAKINLSLHIGSKRADGYHNVESIVAPLTLSDSVTITVDYNSNARRCTVEGPELTPQQARSISGPANLAYRAAEYVLGLSSKTNNLGFDIQISKNIPLEAGLGGGSADAAAVIRLLMEKLKITLSEAHLSAISSKLGADIPCLINPRVKLVTGRGEQLTELELSSSADQFFSNDLVIGLIKPTKGVSTAEAYGWLKREVGGSNIDLSSASKAFMAFLAEEIPSVDDFFAELKDHLQNDFQPVVETHHAGVKEILTAVASERRLLGLLSGSGSTVIVFGFRDTGSIRKLLGHFKERGFFTCETAIALSR